VPTGGAWRIVGYAGNQPVRATTRINRPPASRRPSPLWWHHGQVQHRHFRRTDQPILITEAPVNNDDEFDRRRKRYLVMMTIRAACIVGAATTFRLSGWLAAAFVVAALVLPWSAVLIANDRPPKQELRFRRFVPDRNRSKELLPPEPDPEPEPEPARPRIIDL
jgi:hypothetical protein